MDYTKLIDRRIEIKFQMDRLKEELDKIDADIKDECGIGEILLGSDGHGYKIASQTKYTYGALAVQKLKELNLLEPFVSVSSTKLEDLCKKGKMPWAVYDELKNQATIKEVPMIVQYVPEDAKFSL